MSTKSGDAVDRSWPEGERLALVIGVGAYSESSGWAQLFDTVYDAEEVAKALDDDGDFRVTRKEDLEGGDLSSALCDFLERAPAGSHLIIYFSGHGSPDRGGRSFTLLGADGEGLAGDTLASHMADSGARNIMVVLDCCYSGRFVMDCLSRLYDPRLADRTRYVLAAARSDQQAQGGAEWEGGQLTQAFLEALKTGRVSAKGHLLIEEVVGKVRELFLGRGGQSPCAGGVINTEYPLVWRAPQAQAPSVSVPDGWRITWGKEGQPPDEPSALWIEHHALPPDTWRSTSLAYWDDGLAPWGRESGFPLGSIEVRLRNKPVFDEIWTLWMMSATELGLRRHETWRSVCKYADSVRKGTWLESLPPERSVRMAYLALRETLASTPFVFLRRAYEFCDHLASRVAAGADIFNDDLFVGDHDFTEILQGLEDEPRRYREDKALSRRFNARLAGRDRALIVFPSVRSLLFSYWARRDPEAPGQSGYQLILVDLGAGEIVLSSDPDRRDDISHLAAGLAELELSRHGSVGEGGWYDGLRDHNGTVVAYPTGGTRLTLDDVLEHLTEVLQLRSLED